MKKVYVLLVLIISSIGISSAQHFYSLGYGDFNQANRDTYTNYSFNNGDLDDPNAFENHITSENVFDRYTNNPGVLQSTDSVIIEISFGEIIANKDTDKDTVTYTLMGGITTQGTSEVIAYSKKLGMLQSYTTNGLKYFSFKGVENQKDTIILKVGTEDQIYWLNLWKLGQDWTGKALTSNVISGMGGIVFHTLPINKQLIARDLTTNKGIIQIGGVAAGFATIDERYDSIGVALYRNDILISTEIQKLDYISNSANFSFSIDIEAELANYAIHVFSKKDQVQSTEAEVTEIVAGDVIVITGQSNALSIKFNGASNIYQDQFIRTYASPTDNQITLQNDLVWYQAIGDGLLNTSGHIGQWGLRLAKFIVDSVHIPIAVFNGARGGQMINYFHQKESSDPLSSNFGRLYYRLDQNNLVEKVRAIIWMQGENDAVNWSQNKTTANYKQSYLNLKEAWSNTYPSVSNYYIFQIKNGCNKDLGIQMQIKEAQRQVAAENDDVQIMSIDAAVRNTDNCHHVFEGGYELFAERIFPLIRRDLYAYTPTLEIESPMVMSVGYDQSEQTIRIKTNASQLYLTGEASDFVIENNQNNVSIDEINVSGGDIILSLSGAIDITKDYVSYTGVLQGQTSNFIVNSGGIEPISFYKHPIEVITSSQTTLNNSFISSLYPNPIKDKLHLSLDDRLVNGVLSVLNANGQVLKHMNIEASKLRLDLSDLGRGIYFLELRTSTGQKNIQKIIKR